MSGADPGLLTLLQWLSPAFPTGAFAYSHGLEAAVAAGEVPDAEAAADWIAAVLEFGAGRSDAILLCHALAPGADHAALAALARALAPTVERLRETEEQGAALARALAALGVPGGAGPAPLPVVLGRAAAGLGLAPAAVAALAMQAFAGSLVFAAVRLVPLGQDAGQAILAGLRPLILRLADEAAAAPLDALGGAAPGADLAAARHETLEVRLFRT